MLCCILMYSLLYAVRARKRTHERVWHYDKTLYKYSIKIKRGREGGREREKEEICWKNQHENYYGCLQTNLFVRSIHMFHRFNGCCRCCFFHIHHHMPFPLSSGSVNIWIYKKIVFAVQIETKRHGNENHETTSHRAKKESQGWFPIGKEFLSIDRYTSMRWKWWIEKRSDPFFLLISSKPFNRFHQIVNRRKMFGK